MRHIAAIGGIALLIGMLVISCSLSLEHVDVGTLTVDLPGPDGSNSEIVLGLDTTPDSYRVTVAGSGETQSTVVSAAQATATFASLPPGRWTVTVNARDATGVIVARGIESVTINAGQTTDVTVYVLPLSEEGTLNLTLSWPARTISSPSITGSLQPVGGTPVSIGSLFSIDSSGDPVVATYSESWNAGYYSLALSLMDSSVETWKMIDEAVQIVKEQDSGGTLALSISEMGVLGAVDMDIQPDLRNPYSLSFDGFQSALSHGEEMTVVLDPMATPDTVRWSIDGDSYPDDAGSFTISPAVQGLVGGPHSLNVLVAKDAVLSSEREGFTVTPISVGDSWFFFGDSETDGRADTEPTAISQAVAFSNVWDATYGTAHTSTIFGEGGGITLLESYENYLSTAGTESATWISIQESGQHSQPERGQETPEDFGDTFELFVRHIDANAPNAVITYETAFSFSPEVPERNWTEFNTELRERVNLLAAEGIDVRIAEVAANVDDLIALVGRYEVIQDDDAHYTGLGNLVVALSIYSALGYDVKALDLSYISDSDVTGANKAAAVSVVANQ